MVAMFVADEEKIDRPFFSSALRALVTAAGLGLRPALTTSPSRMNPTSPIW